ncbi:hypothetical protein Tco_0143692 [Tanacetum coccineum]
MAGASHLDEDKGRQLIDHTRFDGYGCSLMYLSASRPDIVFACLYVCKDTRLSTNEMQSHCYKADLSIPKKDHSTLGDVMTHGEEEKYFGSAQFLGHRLVSVIQKAEKVTAILLQRLNTSPIRLLCSNFCVKLALQSNIDYRHHLSKSRLLNEEERFVNTTPFVGVKQIVTETLEGTTGGHNERPLEVDSLTTPTNHHKSETVVNLHVPRDCSVSTPDLMECLEERDVVTILGYSYEWLMTGLNRTDAPLVEVEFP